MRFISEIRVIRGELHSSRANTHRPLSALDAARFSPHALGIRLPQPEETAR
jgi:hypothetical protein